MNVNTLTSDDYQSVVITHGGCADGVASAHMFELFSPQSAVSPHIGAVRIYHSYNRDFSKNRDIPSLKGKKVFITDYSFPIATLINIAREATHLYLWDHHETSFKDLFTSAEPTRSDLIEAGFSIMFTDGAGYVDVRALTASGHTNMMVQGFDVLKGPSDIAIDLTPENAVEITVKSTGQNIKHVCKVNIICNLGMCGAEIAFGELWKMHSGSIDRPWYLTHIRERDLWVWDRPGYVAGIHYNENSRAFGEAFYEAQIRTTTLQAFDKYNIIQIEKLYARGRELMEHNARFIKSIVSKAERVTFESYPAMVATCSIMQSEIGNAIVTVAKNRGLVGEATDQFTPLIGIIVRYNLADNCWNISLRGRIGSPNLADIAKKYGGGGHPLAAGFDYVGVLGDIFKYIERSHGGNAHVSK
jgi:hypothetical protein